MIINGNNYNETNSVNGSIVETGINDLPQAIISEILSHIEPLDLGTCCKVNRNWRILATHALKEIGKKIHKENVFGKEQWEKYFNIEVDEEPPLLSHIELVRIFKSRCPFWGKDGKNVEQTHTGFVLVPKGLTMNKVEELVKEPKEGNATQYADVWYGVEVQYGDIPSEQSYWVMMTKETLPGMEMKTLDEQINTAESVPGYKIPKLLEIITCKFTKYVSSKDPEDASYPSDALTTISCEKLFDGKRIAVGSVSSVGLNIYNGNHVSNAGVTLCRVFGLEKSESSLIHEK